MRDKLGTTGVWNVGFRFAPTDSAQHAAAAAEALGFGAIWLPDAGGHDLFDRLAALLEATSRVAIATGILNLWMHDPTTVARRYLKLNDMYGGRLVLGIGVSHAPLIEQAGVGEYLRPIAKMHSYLDALDDIKPAVPPSARILAALGPAMLGVARDRAAGAHPFCGTVAHTRAARDVLGPAKLLAPEVGVVLESNPTKAREVGRAAVRHNLGLTNYRNNWLRHGLTEGDLAGEGSDRLVDALIGWGDERAIATRITEHRLAGADHVAVQVLTDVDDDPAQFPIQEWGRLAPALLT